MNIEKALQKAGYSLTKKGEKTCHMCGRLGLNRTFTTPEFRICNYCHKGLKRLIEKHARSNAYLLNDLDRRLRRVENELKARKEVKL